MKIKNAKCEFYFDFKVQVKIKCKFSMQNLESIDKFENLNNDYPENLISNLKFVS